MPDKSALSMIFYQMIKFLLETILLPLPLAAGF